MASSLRLGSAILRSSNALSRPTVQKAAFNGVRCASTKVQNREELEQRHH
jgi:citrate synthase